MACDVSSVAMFHLNMILWYSKQILLHCEGAEKYMSSLATLVAPHPTPVSNLSTELVGRSFELALSFEACKLVGSGEVLLASIRTTAMASGTKGKKSWLLFPPWLKRLLAKLFLEHAL